MAVEDGRAGLGARAGLAVQRAGEVVHGGSRVGGGAGPAGVGEDPVRATPRSGRAAPVRASWPASMT